IYVFLLLTCCLPSINISDLLTVDETGVFATGVDGCGVADDSSLVDFSRMDDNLVALERTIAEAALHMVPELKLFRHFKTSKLV
ncbi:hypothetical protein M8C21_023380, partial [Ambrosia artemisiifolia]